MKSKARRAMASHDGSSRMIAGIDQRRDHQAVPVGQHLVVEAGPHARRARVEQNGAQRLQPRPRPPPMRAGALRAVENIVAFEIAFVADVVMPHEEAAGFRADQLDDLVLRPDIELALLAFASRRRARRRSRLAASSSRA